MHSAIRLCVVLLLLPFCCFASDKQRTLKNKMMADLDIIKNTFEVKYAPAEWKKSYCGWDLDEQIRIAKEKIQRKENITVKDYQKIVKEFFLATQDHHVDMFVDSKERSLLPFEVKGSQGRYFISWVYEKIGHPICVGDEVLAFSGRPIQEAIEEIKSRELMSSPTQTAQAFAEKFLTTRMGKLAHTVPKGKVQVGIRHAKSDPNLMHVYEFEWCHKPETIATAGIYRSLHRRQKTIAKQETAFDGKLLSPIFESIDASLNSDPEEYEHPKFLGRKKSDLPPLGEVIWEAFEDVEFHAYLFRTKNKRVIAYIRIPSYVADEESGEIKAYDFGNLINLFEMTSDALIIDQIDNPGGNSMFMYALLSMLSKSPLKVFKERMTLTTEDVSFGLAELEKKEEKIPFLYGYKPSDKFLDNKREFYKFIIQEWNEGRTITTPTYYLGISEIAPHPFANYSKPILVLVNQLDFSGADYFPAILQDNKRAVIFGTRTAGAGGFLLKAAHENLFGLNYYTLTSSIAERLDKNPIENLGVTPDITYEVTPGDLQNNYRGYVEAVDRALNELLKNIPTDIHRPEITRATHPDQIPGRAR